MGHGDAVPGGSGIRSRPVRRGVRREGVLHPLVIARQVPLSGQAPPPAHAVDPVFQTGDDRHGHSAGWGRPVHFCRFRPPHFRAAGAAAHHHQAAHDEAGRGQVAAVVADIESMKPEAGRIEGEQAGMERPVRGISA